MKLTNLILLSAFGLAAFAEEGPKHTRSLGKVGEFDWVQAEEVAVPDLDAGTSDVGKAGSDAPNSFSFRKERPDLAVIFSQPGQKDGKSPGAEAGAAGAENGAAGDGAQEDPNKLLWKDSSTALVDGKPQLVQFGYDASGNIRAVKFADSDKPVMTSLASSFPQKLRSVNGGVKQKIGGREVTSLQSEGQRCQG